MGAGDTDHLAVELQRARADLQYLQAEYAELADPAVQSLDDEHDAEGSTIGFERARVAGLVRRAEQRIAELEAAAERALAGAYSRCERCGQAIGWERLRALPATRICVGCAAAKG